MARLSPCDEPLSWPGANCSRPTTRSPLCARLKSVALPIAPSPITATSKACISVSNPPRRSSTRQIQGLVGPPIGGSAVLPLLNLSPPSEGSNIAAPGRNAGVTCGSGPPEGLVGNDQGPASSNGSKNLIQLGILSETTETFTRSATWRGGPVGCAAP